MLVGYNLIVLFIYSYIVMIFVLLVFVCLSFYRVFFYDIVLYLIFSYFISVAICLYNSGYFVLSMFCCFGLQLN